MGRRRFHHHSPDPYLFAWHDLVHIAKALPMQKTGRSLRHNQVCVTPQQPQGWQVEVIPVQMRDQNRVNASAAQIRRCYLTAKRSHSVAQQGIGQ